MMPGPQYLLGSFEIALGVATFRGGIKVIFTRSLIVRQTRNLVGGWRGILLIEALPTDPQGRCATRRFVTVVIPVSRLRTAIQLEDWKFIDVGQNK